MACGILYTISQLCRLKKHKLLLLNRNTNNVKQDTSNAETIDDILAKGKVIILFKVVNNQGIVREQYIRIPFRD